MLDPITTFKVTLPCKCRKWQGPLAGRAYHYDYTSDMCETHRAEYLTAYAAQMALTTYLDPRDLYEAIDRVSVGEQGPDGGAWYAKSPRI